MRLTLVLLLAALTVSCGYGSNNSGMMGGSAPSIQMLIPSNTAAGGPAFIVTVNGSHFAPGAMVFWNNMPQNTTVATAGQVTAMIPAALIANAGNASVYVRSGGMNSNQVTFNVQ
jgi:IPT/TIG domain-containing protein